MPKQPARLVGRRAGEEPLRHLRLNCLTASGFQESRSSIELRGAPHADHTAAHRGIPQTISTSLGSPRTSCSAGIPGCQCRLCAGGAQPSCCQRFEARKHSRPAVERCVMGRTSMPAKRITLRVVHWRPGARRASGLRYGGGFFTEARPLLVYSCRAPLKCERVSRRRTA